MLKYIFFFDSLKWYLLGKHAHVVFTENRNTENTIGSQLINIECLSASVLKSSEIDVDNLAEVNYSDGSCTAEVSQDQMDLLKCFEKKYIPKNIYYNYMFN